MDPRPEKVMRSGSLCRVCSQRDSETCRLALLQKLAEHGARPGPNAVWRGVRKAFEIECAHGHITRPLPGNVLSGVGVCGACSVAFDRVYLLHHAASRAIKVGVAGADARVRQHERRGYVLVAQWVGLEHTQAQSAERHVIKGWRSNAVPAVPAAPVDGRTETAPATALTATLHSLRARLGEPERP